MNASASSSSSPAYLCGLGGLHSSRPSHHRRTLDPMGPRHRRIAGAVRAGVRVTIPVPLSLTSFEATTEPAGEIGSANGGYSSVSGCR